MSPKEYNINVTPILCDWRNYMDKINSFYKMLKYNAEKYPDKEAIIYDTMTVTLIPSSIILSTSSYEV